MEPVLTGRTIPVVIVNFSPVSTVYLLGLAAAVLVVGTLAFWVGFRRRPAEAVAAWRTRRSRAWGVVWPGLLAVCAVIGCVSNLLDGPEEAGWAAAFALGAAICLILMVRAWRR